MDQRAQRCRSCWGKAHAGANATGWKGGRTHNVGTGYVRVINAGHPRAAGGYVLEHVLVVEEVIGRYLLPGENVHHKNGVRDDNRPENLELWISSQPAGQRVSDQIEWATELLRLYAPDRLAG